MPEDIKQALAREAQINGRSLNQEIVARLKASLASPAPLRPERGYTAVHDAAASFEAAGLSDADRQMLAEFRKLPPGKQLALLELFR